MNTWIDFRDLRKQLAFDQVLRHYKVKGKIKGKQFTAICPLQTHKGKKNSPTFSANLEKGIWQCFGCSAKGNVLDFAARMEGFDPEKGEELRKAALLVQKEFGIKAEKGDAPSKSPLAVPASVAVDSKEEVVINAPLDFELKELDPNHSYLLNRGFTPETIRAFGLGFCKRGYFKDRIAIPLHDHEGGLIGYAGRLSDDSLISDQNPKYLFPGERKRKGITYSFQKTLFLYNGHRITAPADDLIVVEGFPSVWWLYQHSIANVVGLMGWSVSETQAKLIVSLTKTNGRVWLMPDGDESGERCADSALLQISPYRFMRWVRLVEEKQPTDYDRRSLEALLNK